MNHLLLDMHQKDNRPSVSPIVDLFLISVSAKASYIIILAEVIKFQLQFYSNYLPI